jgi:hypothetical protein
MGALTPEDVWRLEALLDLSAEASDPARPVVCFDEHAYARQAEVCPPLPPAPAPGRRRDHEYERRGACSVAVAFDRHRGWRHGFVSEHRASVDCAGWVREVVDVYYPDATLIRLVVDHLTTHSPAALSATVPPDEAHRLARKLEFHDTPKHGSWLNMVEIEFSVLSRQCLHRRLESLAVVAAEVRAWAAARNAVQATVDWRLTTDHARVKLHRHYPT